MTMRSENPYGSSQVRRSLIHFVFGKGAAAVIGFSLLLLIVRALPANEYGVYVAFLAVLEITQLASNLGLFASAYRYVPELRSQNQGVELHNLLVLLSILRLITLVAAMVLIGFFIKPLFAFLNLQGYEQLFVVYGFVVVAEGFARYLDILFDSLLLQKYSQIAIFIRNGFRLIGLVFLMSTKPGDISLVDWVKVELFASLVGAIISAILLFKYSMKLRSTSPGIKKDKVKLIRYLVFVGPSYLAQLIGLIYGAETTKLILTKVSGALQVGAFGFAASVSAMLQRYLPVFLLLGLVRPLFVSEHNSVDQGKRLNQLANIVLKLNLFVLFPSIAFMFASGDHLASLLSGGKFSDVGGFLIIFMVLLVFQTWHAVLGLVTLAIEDGVSGLNGTILGLLGLGGGVAFLPLYGAYSLGVGLVLSEVIWCVYVYFSLQRNGLTIKNDWLGIVKIFTFSIIGWMLIKLMPNLIHIPQQLTILVNLLTIGIVFTLMAYLIKPFTNEERTLINRILPRPIFVW